MHLGLPIMLQQQINIFRPKCQNALLHLFEENANTSAMVKHSMFVVQQATIHFNPTQILVITADQPIFALAKQAQWNGQSHGKSLFVIVVGGSHLDIAFLRVIGELLDRCGWCKALVNGNITTTGRADSLTGSSHVTRFRWAHEVTCAALYALQQAAYRDFVTTNCGSASPEHYQRWCTEQSKVHPQFKFWSLILHLELLLLQHIKSIRQEKFNLYIECLGQMVQWFFALNFTHYSRWLPVHIRDMIQLEETHPDVYRHAWQPYCSENISCILVHGT